MMREKKALLVIEALCEDKCLRTHKVSEHPKNCFYCLIYTTAHSVSQSCIHRTWWEKTKKLYRHFARQ